MCALIINTINYQRVWKVDEIISTQIIYKLKILTIHLCTIIDNAIIVYYCA